MQRCSLCHKPSILKWSTSTRDYFHCHHCDLVFVPKEQHLGPTEEKARYCLHDNTLENSGYVRMFTDKFPILAAHWQDVVTVLDYGSGPGPVLVELLNREGYRAVGYDPYFAPDTDLAGPYDAVISTEAFEHFSSPARDLHRLVSSIRTGGYLAIMTMLRTDQVAFLDWWYMADPTHVALYSSQTLSWIAEAYRLSIRYSNNHDFIIYQKD